MRSEGLLPSVQMCGIAGELRSDAGIADLAAVARMSAAMDRRGSDGAGVWSQGRVALVHRRLKVIDLSERAAQPMVDPELGLTVRFNGYIYNYTELRRELAVEGYRFFSSGDVEVVLKAYHRWGIDAVDHLHGMFACAVVEIATGRTVPVRDRLGIKPLYLAEVGGALRFASTLPALLAGGGVDTTVDHRRPRRPPPLPEPALGRAPTQHHRRRRQQAGTGHGAGGRTRRLPAQSSPLAAPPRTQARARQHDRPGLERRHPRGVERTDTGTVLPLKASGHRWGEEVDIQPVGWEHVEVRVDEPVDDAAGLVALGIQVGDFVAFDAEPVVTPSGYLKSRHLDDKAGVAVYLQTDLTFRHWDIAPAGELENLPSTILQPADDLGAR